MSLRTAVSQGKITVEFSISDLDTTDLIFLAKATVSKLINSDRLSADEYEAFTKFLRLSGEVK